MIRNGQKQFMTSTQGAVTGCVGDACGNGNINLERVEIAAGGGCGCRRGCRSCYSCSRCMRYGGKKHARKHTRKHRGGAYGVAKTQTVIGRGIAGVEYVDTCSQQPSEAKVHLVGGKKYKTKKDKKRYTKKKAQSRRKNTKRSRYSRRMRGGANLPSTPIVSLPGESLPATRSAEANPPPAGRMNYNGTGNCVDNYNHYTGTSKKN